MWPKYEFKHQKTRKKSHLTGNKFCFENCLSDTRNKRLPVKDISFVQAAHVHREILRAICVLLFWIRSTSYYVFIG